MTERAIYPQVKTSGQPQERLKASFLDRLIDQEPEVVTDPPVPESETSDGLRAALRRDLEILLNTRCVPTTPPSDFSELRDSLFSLGVEDFFAASLITDIQREVFAKQIEARIALFEPRLEDLSVTLLEDQVPERRSLRLRIFARYHARPGLPPIVFETSMDPMAGRYTVKDSRRPGPRNG